MFTADLKPQIPLAVNSNRAKFFQCVNQFEFEVHFEIIETMIEIRAKVNSKSLIVSTFFSSIHFCASSILANSTKAKPRDAPTCDQTNTKGVLMTKFWQQLIMRAGAPRNRSIGDFFKTFLTGRFRALWRMSVHQLFRNTHPKTPE